MYSDNFENETRDNICEQYADVGIVYNENCAVFWSARTDDAIV